MDRERATDPGGARREILRTWGAAVGLLALASGLARLDPTGVLAGNLGGVAAVLFVLLADRRLASSGRSWGDVGLAWWGLGDARTWRAWGRGTALALAAAANLVMGEAAEGIPAVHVRGFPYPLREGSLKELIRRREQDLFR